MSSKPLQKTVEAKVARANVLNEARRALILDAARSAFFELGLEGASLREIAKRAGYTPGAIYSYFANLEEIYGALLGESLERLNQTVGAANATKSAAALVQSKAKAFYQFYRDNPNDLDLGFYLFNGTKPRGLTPELNEHLNNALLSSLTPLQDAIEALGLSNDQAVRETTGVFAQIVGILILNNTGRIRLFQQNPDDLFSEYMGALICRLGSSQ